MTLTLEELFNERLYLASNPGVAAAVANGSLSSGFFHFTQFGQFEGRDPNPIFNSAFYLDSNPDVASIVQQNQLTPIEHFLEFGQFERRDPSQFFDTNFYLDRNPEVAEAINADALSAIEHFVNFGQFEGRIPRPLFSQIVVFGDSLADTGNSFFFSAGTIPPSPPYFDGRFANGPIWVETLPPLIELEANPDTNFAFGGATTGNFNVFNAFLPENTPSLPGLQNQIDDFLRQVSAADPNALYVVSAGANDYIAGGSTDVQTTVGNLSAAISKLAAVGARNFIVPNQPDFGDLPRGRDIGGEAQLQLSLLAQAHNSALAAALATLEQDENINIIGLDINSPIDDAIANPADFGFTNVTDDFLTSGAASADGFLFWDDIHPTAAAHDIVADTAVKTMTEISELVSILETSPGF